MKEEDLQHFSINNVSLGIKSIFFTHAINSQDADFFVRFIICPENDELAFVGTLAEELNLGHVRNKDDVALFAIDHLKQNKLFRRLISPPHGHWIHRPIENDLLLLRAQIDDSGSDNLRYEFRSQSLLANPEELRNGNWADG